MLKTKKKEELILEPLKEVESEHASVKLYNTEDGRLVLTLDSYIQFIEGEDEENYHRGLINNAYKLHPEAKEFLILGGGDGLAARTIFELCPDANITLVDIDKAIINLGKFHPRLVKLNKNSLEKCDVIIEDAKKWIKKTRETFDIIICDFPDANNKKLEKLYSIQFYKNVISKLKENGVISIQCNYTIGQKIKKHISSLLPQAYLKKVYMPFLEYEEIVVGVKHAT